MIKIQHDKRGPFVRYKGRLLRVPQKMLAASQKELLKWIVKKIFSFKKRIKRKLKLKLKPEIKQEVDRNLERIKQGEALSKQTEDKQAVKSYINAVRAQQKLPPIDITGVPTLTTPTPRPADIQPVGAPTTPSAPPPSLPPPVGYPALLPPSTPPGFVFTEEQVNMAKHILSHAQKKVKEATEITEQMRGKLKDAILKEV